MTKTVYKNITYMEPHNLYRVSVMRNLHSFNAYFKNLEDAVEALKRVNAFYEMYKELPSPHDLGVGNRCLGKDSTKNISFHDQSGLWRVCIYRDRNRFVVYTKSKEEAIDLRDKAIEFYNLNSRLPEKIEISDSYENTPGKRSNVLENVTYDKFAKKWRCRIVRGESRVDSLFNTFKQAKCFRSRVLNYYKTNGQLPDKNSDF